jgi:uncharacterized repeat protein (TIGR01451 family)
MICLAAALLSAAGGCSTSRPLASTDPFLEDPIPTGVELPFESRQGVQLASAESPAGQTVTADYMSPSRTDRSAKTPAVHQAAYEEREGTARIGDGAVYADSAIMQTAYQQSAPSSAASAQAVSFTPAQPRVPAPGGFPDACPPYYAGHPGHSGYPGHAWPLAVSLPQAHPEEYLFDGGDRGYPVHYSDFARLGLETEDTIAEYTDHLGRHHMKPSTRVAIYAPRFGAVRTISALKSDFAVEKLAGAFDTAYGVGLSSRTAPTMHQQRDAADGVRMRSRASGLDAEAAQGRVDQATALLQHTKFVNTFQDLTFVRTGQFQQADRARLAYGIQAALTWTRDVNPVVMANLQSGGELISTFRGKELVGIEDDHKTAGRLRIIKLADKKVAAPGEVVTFTLRYDNLGDLEVFHVRLVDNLTPRLEYIEDSATSDRPGQIFVEDNHEGSVILTFELDDPLPGHEGGILTFQARVK